MLFLHELYVYIYIKKIHKIKKKKNNKCLQCLSFAFCSESGNSKSKKQQQHT